MNEIDSLLRFSSEGLDVKIGDSEAMKSRVDEWLRTPEGSIYGLPEWGNPLARYKHEPMNTFTEVALENAIMSGIKRDIPGISLTGIRIEELDKDLFYLSITMPWGEYNVGLQKG